MTNITSHEDVIGLWPTTAEFARALSRHGSMVSDANARNMKARGVIPPVHFYATAKAAEECGFEGITYARLVELGRP